MALAKTSKYLKKLAADLFAPPACDGFLARLLAVQPVPGALIWIKDRPQALPFKLEQALSWQPEFIDRIAVSERPGANVLHTQGYYYCLDFSSVFAAAALSAVPAGARLILDLCAAPGGKSVYAYRLFRPELLICNEVIGKRIGALASNVKRLALSPVLITNHDSKVLATICAQSFDLVVCDVPCSGQSLLAKGEKSPGCFHPATINLNSNRQKRILANALTLVCGGGYLAYMTCTYTRKENEAILEWALKRFSDFSPVNVPLLSEFQSHLADFPCYRLWPQSGLGAGAFVGLLRNNGGARNALDIQALRPVWSSPAH